MSFQLDFTQRSRKTLKSLDRVTLKRLQVRFLELAVDPFDRRISKEVRMSLDRRTSRVGDWRIIYYLDAPRRAVVIAAICSRDKAYDKV